MIGGSNLNGKKDNWSSGVLYIITVQGSYTEQLVGLKDW